MTEINEYCGAQLLKEPELKLFYCGSAKLDCSWHGKVTCSTVSRLYYVKRGSFFLIINGEKMEFTQGNWYLVPSGSNYEYGCNSEAEQLFFHFNLYGTEKIDLFGRISSVLILKENCKSAEQITGYFTSQTIVAALFIKNEVMKILLKMISEHKLDVGNSKYSPCVIKAINYINKNLSENLTIKSISKAIFVSESTLTKRMRNEIGTTVNNYIDDLILTRAAQMIREGSMSLNNISNHFGFCDQFYFSRKFKAKFGITPSEYKKLRDI